MRQGAGGLSPVKADKLKDCEKHPVSGNACSTPSCLKCLKDSKDVLWNNIFYDALNEGLITKEEFDVFNDDTYLKTDMFNTLIERFINKTRYKYIDKEDGCYNSYKFYKQTDTSDKMTYYEWLCDVIESQK